MFVPNHRSARRSINSSNVDSSFDDEQEQLLDEEEFADGGVMESSGNERGRQISPQQVSNSMRSFGDSLQDSNRYLSSQTSTYSRNDDEKKLIEAVLNTNSNGLTTRDKKRDRLLFLNATLVTDPTKNMQIEVKMGDTLRYVQVLIGDKMKV